MHDDDVELLTLSKKLFHLAYGYFDYIMVDSIYYGV